MTVAANDARATRLEKGGLPAGRVSDRKGVRDDADRGRVGETTPAPSQVTPNAMASLVPEEHERFGRRNRYTIVEHLPLPDPLVREQSVGDLLRVLAPS
jgi:hypothetical protein